jgi:predicted TIM-barrel fold metal-dependent hydrolase
VNLFFVDHARQTAITQLPRDISDSERAKRVREIDTNMGQMLRDSNIAFCKMVQQHRKLIPFVGIDPSSLCPKDLEAHYCDMVEKYGAKGIKIHPVVQRFFPSDKRMWPIYEACSELGTPILSHSGPARGREQYAEPRAFAEVLETFPKLKLILAHLGGGAWRQTLEIACMYPNTYFDCCEIIEWASSSVGPSIEELARLIKEVGPERVMMGSDFPTYAPDRAIELVRALPILSDDDKKAVLGENAVRILQI